ncbi:MAG: energy transducer TonB [Paracoccaceae bacterium]
MTRGTYISGIGHGGFILWALFGGIFLSSRDPLPVQASDVSLISSQEFAALTLPNDAPPVPFDAPQSVEPGAEDDAPQISPTVEDIPEPPNPPEVSPPQTDETPVLPNVVPESVPELIDQPPVVPIPPAIETPPDVVQTDDPPQPAPAPRVAPTPAAQPEPDTEIADTVAPEVVPDETADTVAEESPATAPQEAASEIVTEAETPSAAPVASARPTARPTPPVQVAQPETVESDPVADAVAEALASTDPDPTPPTGPPLTGSEKEGFRVAVGKCWNVGSLSSEALATTVIVGVSMGKDGHPNTQSIKMLSFSGGTESAAQRAFEAAKRAIIRCGAKGFDLPLEKYSQWQDIEMTFNPEGMRMR